LLSEQVAAEMASGALAASDASLAVAITGIAGPGGSDFKPEGRVCFGLATQRGVTTQLCDCAGLSAPHIYRLKIHHLANCPRIRRPEKHLPLFHARTFNHLPRNGKSQRWRGQ